MNQRRPQCRECGRFVRHDGACRATGKRGQPRKPCLGGATPPDHQRRTCRACARVKAQRRMARPGARAHKNALKQQWKRRVWLRQFAEPVEAFA